jgi:putative Mg2+ transporter-C (MgtC) family protein
MSAFFASFADHFQMAQIAEFFLRIFVACVCGAVIGFERSKRFKEAGIRTHIIVCCAAALFTVVSKYGFADMASADGTFSFATHGTDPARVAAQVVSGISFLCAGVIFKNEGLVKGLTTAAGLWFTAGLGLAVGSGLIFLGIIATVLISAIQYLMHRYAVGADAYAANRIQFTVKSDTDFHEALLRQLEQWNAQVAESKIAHRRDGTTDYDLILRRRTEIGYKELKTFMDSRPEILSASNSPIR